MKFNIVAFVMAAFFFNLSAHGQNEQADSLRRQLQTEEQDTSRALLYTKLGRMMLYSNPDSAMLMAQKGLALSEQIGYVTGEIVNLNLTGSIYNVTGNYPKALEILLSALKKSESTGDQENISRLMTSVGIVYAYEGDQRQCIDYNLKALKIAEQNNFENRKAVNLLNIGDGFEKLDILDSALAFTNRAYELAVKLNNEDYIGITLNNLGNIYSKMKYNEVAMGNYRLGVPYLIRMENSETLCETYLGQARLFEQSGNNDSCLFYAKKSFQIAQNGAFTSQVMNASSYLADYYKSVGNIDSAFIYQSETIAAKDKQFSQEKAMEIQRISIDEISRQQKIEEARLAQENQRKLNMQYAILGASLIGLILIFLLLTKSIIVKESWIRFLGVLSLLLVFEFLNMFVHPVLATLTHHSPFLMLVALVLVAAILIPAHHKLEHWVTTRLMEKNRQIKLSAAKHIMETINNDPPVT
ncbi:MAG TPA: tetratricopeptide repeat protein [Bacteroidia bacterium]|nr:tetratricopeptide repeat protein [Bacteroidia bacterium]